LAEAAGQRGWRVGDDAVYSDNGVSGAKGRAARPELDRLLKNVSRGHYDVVMAWSVDRLGRSLADLIGTLQELHGARCDLFLHQQGLDTTTPAGRAMFQMMGVFAEFERSMIQARVVAGLERAKVHGTKSGKAIGRPALGPEMEAAVRERLQAGMSLAKTAKELGIAKGSVVNLSRRADVVA
jgi:DNA invertase Pin-like site-specific DNA recombinase